MLSNNDVSRATVMMTERVAFQSFLGLLDGAFRVDGFRGVMQISQAVLGGYDAALAACEEQAAPHNTCLATAATHLSLGLLPKLGDAIEAELERKGAQ